MLPVTSVVITFPVTLPFKAPSKTVEVIEVTPVTTPALILISSSSKIAEPVGASRIRFPVDALIVFVSILILSTCKAVRVPTLSIAGCAAVVTVAAVVALPVTSPVTFPVNIAGSLLPTLAFKTVVSVLPVTSVVITFPVTLPFKAPSKTVEVIEVTPVTTPALILISSSSKIAEPVGASRIRFPVDALIVFVSILILSTCKLVKGPYFIPTLTPTHIIVATISSKIYFTCVSILY